MECEWRAGGDVEFELLLLSVECVVPEGVMLPCEPLYAFLASHLT